MNWNSASGAAPSEVRSISTSRNGFAGDREIRRHVDRGNDGVGQRRIVLREDAEAVADLVARCRYSLRSISMWQVCFSEPSPLSRVRLTKRAVDRMRARIAEARIVRLLRRGGGLGRDLFGVDDAAAHLLDQRLQHARGGLAARARRD